MAPFSRLQCIGTVCTAALLLQTVPAHAESVRSAHVAFRPHCELTVQDQCPLFPVRDPVSLTTQALQAGDTLDMDIVLQNPHYEPVWEYSVWLAYDPTFFDGIGIKPGKDFPAVEPGGTDFFPQEGFIKLHASRTGTAVNGKTLVLGRVVLRVKDSAMTHSSVLSIEGASTDASGHTFARSVEGGPNILATEQGSLFIPRAGGAEVSSAEGSAQSSVNTLPDIIVGPTSSASSLSEASVSSVMSGSSDPTTASSFPSGNKTTFALLQVQNVHLGTEGSTIYVVWDPLRSSDLIGYNLYYGTTPGEYLQRRSILPTSTSAALRTLPAGTTYYVAVRGVNAANEETAFSREMRITVGNPKSSTAPLTRNPVTGQHLPGVTGMPPGSLLILLTGAIVILMQLFKRQLRSR